MRGFVRAGFIAAAVVLAAFQESAQAQQWPTRAVTIVVPFTAGATSDIVARSLAQHLSEIFGQPFIVDNRGGAGGNIGGAMVARAAADGYTLFLATTGPAATNKLMYANMSFDPEKDFAPVVLVGKSPVFITANNNAPFTSLKEFIDYAKANPDKVNAGFPGNGTLGHITGILLQKTAGIEFGLIPYKGSAAILTDLMGGNIDVGMDSMGGYVQAVLAGQIKALAIASSQRWPKLANVPTASEAGLPGFEASVWYALLAPAKTPPEVIAKLNEATNAYIRSDKAKTFFDNLAIQPAGGSPDELRAFTASELAKWGPIIEQANIRF